MALTIRTAGFPPPMLVNDSYGRPRASILWMQIWNFEWFSNLLPYILNDRILDDWEWNHMGSAAIPNSSAHATCVGRCCSQVFWSKPMRKVLQADVFFVSRVTADIDFWLRSDISVWPLVEPLMYSFFCEWQHHGLFYLKNFRLPGKFQKTLWNHFDGKKKLDFLFWKIFH